MAVNQGIMLDIGCGFNKQEGYIGMDKRDVKGVDIVHDLEVFPWPIEDGSCAVVVASHVVEHIKPWHQIDLMNECWRVLRDGGVLMIAVPHGQSFGYMQDPTHCTPWNRATPEYYDPKYPLYQVYRPKPWTIENMVCDKYTSIEVSFRKANHVKEEN